MDFIGNYFQHMMKVLFDAKKADFQGLQTIYENLLGTEVSLNGIKKSYKTEGRGNLPRNVSEEDFYDYVLVDLYDKKLVEFAEQFCLNLEQDGIFPEEWATKADLLGCDAENFDPTLFREFIYDLFKRDKIARKNEKDHLRIKGIAGNRSGTTLYKKKKQALTSLEYSCKFLNAGARALVGRSEEELDKELQTLSRVFSSITRVEMKNDPNKLQLQPHLLMEDLRDFVISALQDGESKEVMKIKGPLGSYKNRVMQYLYLALEKKAEFFTPLYINIASYERAAEGDKAIGEEEFLESFTEDMSRATEIFEANPEKLPLLMIDGIRDFYFNNETLYFAIARLIQEANCYTIVCMDTDFTLNNLNQFHPHPLVSNHYKFYVRIRSMNLNHRAESVQFIKNCMEGFQVALPQEITAEAIYENLVRLGFMTIDAYWLVYLLTANFTDIVNHNNNISRVYNAICLSYLGSHKMVISAAEFAFEFEFGNKNFGDTNPFYDLRWRLIRKHRSILDFLIATFYIKKVSELDLQGAPREENIKKLEFFNMVLQKSITRFVVSMLKGVDDYERQIMIIAKHYYDDLQLFGKSELTFWMARLQNPVRKRQCVNLLKKYREKELEVYRANKFSSEEEKRKTAFLIRGICVSLIYEEDRESAKYYLDSLLEDEVAHSVNRGFHLEYYGDKPYIPNKTLLDFEDDITVGESTFTVLCLSMDRRMRRRETSSHVAILEVMTLCHLLQARIEYNREETPMDVSPYVDKCISYLNWIIRQRIVRGLEKVCNYFYWFHGELVAFKKGRGAAKKAPVYYHASVMNTFGRAASVNRTGWVEMGISRPENIVEHMYNCWLIGMLYLPETAEEPNYSKSEILQMLLVHDLGETVTGDINRPEKQTNPAYYNQQEREVMNGLFLSGTYPGAVSLNGYMDVWRRWDRREGINYLVAKDIDNIQTIYQFCTYYVQAPDEFSLDDVRYWLGGLSEIETDQGKEIADKLILENPLYKTLVEETGISEI